MGSTYDTLQLLKNILPNLDANVFSNWASRDLRDQQFIEGVKQVLPDNVKWEILDASLFLLHECYKPADQRHKEIKNTNDFLKFIAKESPSFASHLPNPVKRVSDKTPIKRNARFLAKALKNNGYSWAESVDFVFDVFSLADFEAYSSDSPHVKELKDNIRKQYIDPVYGK